MCVCVCVCVYFYIIVQYVSYCFDNDLVQCMGTGIVYCT